MLPDILMRLDPDTREHAIALAVEIVTAPQPVIGLTTQQAKIAQVLRGAGGRWVSYDALAEAVCTDPLSATTPSVIAMQLCKMRGHPMRDRIETGGRKGSARGMARWVA